MWYVGFKFIYKVATAHYALHVIQMSLERKVKCLTFNEDKNVRRGRPVEPLLNQVTDNEIEKLCNIPLGKKVGRST